MPSTQKNNRAGGVMLDADPAACLPLMADDPVLAAYLFGMMMPPYSAGARWATYTFDGEPRSAVVTYDAGGRAALFTLGDAYGAAAILEVFDDLPDEVHAAFPLTHNRALSAHYFFSRRFTMQRMVLDEMPPAPTHPVEQLDESDLADLVALCRHGDRLVPDPHQVSSGGYVGIRMHGRLVASAGVHLINAREKMAMVGNVVTDKDHRRHGYAASCLAYLAGNLVHQGLTVCLNVDERNAAAVKLYGKLRFATRLTYAEAIGNLFRPW